MNAVTTEELKSVESSSVDVLNRNTHDIHDSQDTHDTQRIGFETLKLEKRLCREVGDRKSVV